MLLNGPIWGQLTKLNWSYSSPQGAAFMGGGLHGAQHRCADLGWKYLWGCCTSKAFLVLGSAGWLAVSLQFCSLCGVHSVLCLFQLQGTPSARRPSCICNCRASTTRPPALWMLGTPTKKQTRKVQGTKSGIVLCKSS